MAFTSFTWCNIYQYWLDIILVCRGSYQKFSAPSDGVVYAVGDGSHKEKRSKKNPTVQKGRKSKDKPFFWGIKFVLIALCWDVYRIPVGFRIILPKTHPDYKKENVLFREMLSELSLPGWAKTVIVTGDSGYGAKENMKLIQKMDKERSKNRRWFFVFSIAEHGTRKTEKV